MLDSTPVVSGYEAPEMVHRGITYKLLPKSPDPAYYAERTDRNIGWITNEEQEMLHRSVIGIAGCGGMGGQIAEKFLRLGVGELRIADSEVFDVSNINRQFAATRLTVGKSKALETAKMLRNITDDATLMIYPQGICEATVSDFVRRCDVICDEIEFWCVGARILLHRVAKGLGVPVFVCNTAGFGSHLFLFTPQGVTMEGCLGLEYEEAKQLEEKLARRQASGEEITLVMQAVTRGLFPEWQEYCTVDSQIQNRALTRERLLREGRGAIIATNPPLACGFIADRVLLHLLRNSPVKRDIAELPEMPGYFYLDAAKMETKIVRGRWW